MTEDVHDEVMAGEAVQGDVRWVHDEAGDEGRAGYTVHGDGVHDGQGMTKYVHDEGRAGDAVHGDVQGDVRWVQDEAGADGADDGDVTRVEVQGASEEASAGATDAVSEMHGGGRVQEDGRKRKRREGGRGDYREGGQPGNLLGILSERD